MDIVFKCALCEQEMTVDASAAGTEFKCPSCGKLMVVPEASTQGVVGKDALRLERGQSEHMQTEDAVLAKKLCKAFEKITTEIAKAIVGQNDVIEQIVIAIFARSHCLLEGVPGLAKTYMVKSLSEALHLSFRRIQFTPDLMPADITGTDIISEDPATGR